jgi:hypothetical protein
MYGGETASNSVTFMYNFVKKHSNFYRAIQIGRQFVFLYVQYLSLMEGNWAKNSQLCLFVRSHAIILRAEAQVRL